MINMNITTSNVEFSSYPSREWIVDIESGTTGDTKDSLESVAQDIYFALSTNRYKYPIMGSNFGATFDDLVGADYSYIRSEVARRIRDALSIDDRVISVGDFTFTLINDGGLEVACIVKTTYGNVTGTTTISV